MWVPDVALIFKSTSSWWLATRASHDFHSFCLTSRAPLELMKKCFQHQFLILLSVICYSAALCSLARALFNPFNVHPSFVIFLITASHNIHSCNGLLSFLIIQCSQKWEKNVKQAAIFRLWSRSMKRKVFLSALATNFCRGFSFMKRLRTRSPIAASCFAYLYFCPNNFHRSRFYNSKRK